MLKLCVAGAAGRMGNAIIAEATSKGHQIVRCNRSSKQSFYRQNPAGTRHNQFRNANPEFRQIERSLQDADTYISFTVPAAEVINIPIVANLGKRIILGHHRIHTRAKPSSCSCHDRQSSSSVLTKLLRRR